MRDQGFNSRPNGFNSHHKVKHHHVNKYNKRLDDSRIMAENPDLKQAWAKRGDSWVSQASNDLGKVKGKDFRKQMQKMKRASWRGTGELDMGVNSMKFPDSDNE